MTGDATIGAVVVNFNAGPHLAASVRSLRSAGADRIVVVDNRSTDDSLAALSGDEAEVIQAGANLGYGRAANRGVTDLTTDLVLIANADIVVDPTALKELRAALDRDPGLGIVGPRLENEQGEVYPSPRVFPSMLVACGHAFLGFVWPANPASRRYRMLDADRSQPLADVDWVSGSCFLARRSAWETIGGFDEGYFMYSEDVDLCWRIKQRGWRVGFEPAARVIHIQGVSTNQHPYRMIVEHHRSLLRFWWRSTGPAGRLAFPLVALGLALRAALACGQRALQGRRSG